MENKKSKPWLIFINAFLIFLVAVSLIVDVAFVYYKITNKDYTTGTNYINDQTAIDAEIKNKEDMTETEVNELEERWLFDVNLFSNYNENGEILAELRVNYFSDYTLTQNSYISAGMQQVGKKATQPDLKSKTDEFWQTYIDERYFYYTSTDDVTYSGGTSNASIATTFNRDLKLTVKVAQKPYQIQLTGYTYEYYKNWLGIQQKGAKIIYTWSTFFNDLMYTVTTSSYGEGDYYLSKCNLSKYFTLYGYDENGKVVEDNLTDFIDNYCVVKVHYEKNGAKNVNQSIFKIIAGNPNYGLKDINTTYAQNEFVYTLTSKNLSLRYSEIFNGNFIYLNLDIKNLIDSQPNHITNLEINLDDFKEDKILGFDFSAFENFKINSITLKSNKEMNFKLCDKALFNSGLKELRHSSTINLEISSTAINNEFLEVIL